VNVFLCLVWPTSSWCGFEKKFIANREGSWVGSASKAIWGMPRGDHTPPFKSQQLLPCNWDTLGGVCTQVHLPTGGLRQKCLGPAVMNFASLVGAMLLRRHLIAVELAVGVLTLP